MGLMDKFDRLSEANRLQDILYILENDYYSLAITLISGDILLGDPTTDFDREYLPYSEKYKGCVKGMELPISDNIALLFPDDQGMIYGSSYAVSIPVTLIARIQGLEPLINIDNEKMSFDHPGGSLALRNLPNPLSKIIRDRNCEIIKRLHLLLLSYNEEAISEKAILGENITLSREQIIYADWDYIKNNNGGLKSIGGSIFGFGISFGVDRSNNDLASIKLREDSAYKGIIKDAGEEQSTQVEGDNAKVYDFRLSGGTPRSMPLLIKDKCAIIPKEIIHYIGSELTVSGDLYQIPTYMNGERFESYLLARVIGYLPYRMDNA